MTEFWVAGWLFTVALIASEARETGIGFGLAFLYIVLALIFWPAFVGLWAHEVFPKPKANKNKESQQ